ncbi:MAG: hypothetical protein WCG27_11670, partial [Pseudomonadota bacterium]
VKVTLKLINSSPTITLKFNEHNDYIVSIDLNRDLPRTSNSENELANRDFSYNRYEELIAANYDSDHRVITFHLRYPNLKNTVIDWRVAPTNTVLMLLENEKGASLAALLRRLALNGRYDLAMPVADFLLKKQTDMGDVPIGDYLIFFFLLEMKRGGPSTELEKIWEKLDKNLLSRANRPYLKMFEFIRQDEIDNAQAYWRDFFSSLERVNYFLKLVKQSQSAVLLADLKYFTKQLAGELPLEAIKMMEETLAIKKAPNPLESF